MDYPFMSDEKIDITQLRKSLRRKSPAASRLKLASEVLPPPPATGGEPLVYHRDLPHRREAPQTWASPGQPVRLCDAVEGKEVRTAGGAAFVIESHVDNDVNAAFCDEFASAVTNPDSDLRGHLLAADPVSGGDLTPGDLLFFDLETTGLSSTPVFLIGVMIWSDGRLLTRQFFARTYAEERVIVEMFVESLQAARMLVSFNGKSYDLPYLRARAAATGVKLAYDGPHLDLLHVSRRAWKKQLPNCRLQTLEAHICGRHREDDIPGYAIPQAYHDFVRTGDARQMVQTLHHNRLDLITLADLMLRLPGMD